MTSTGNTIGIDIGGTSVRAAVIDEHCRIIGSRQGLTPSTTEQTEDLLAQLIKELAAEHRVRAVGLAVAGFVTPDRLRVMFAPHLAWRDDPVPRRLSERTGLPVVMDHDVNSAAWAEYRHGAGAGSPVSLLIALGTGIGAGLVVDGSIYRGAHGVAPELGHVVVVPGGRSCPCGKRGCWERYCSGTALAATACELSTGGLSGRLAEMSGGEPGALTGTMVAQAAGDGDAVALAAMDDLGRWLGVGLSMATDILDPEVIVIGGGVSAAAPYFLSQAVTEMSATITGTGHRPEPRIELAHFGGNAGIVGAALLAAAESAG